MKLFLSADIEGTCGIDDWDETNFGGSDYELYRSLMLGEVNSVCSVADKLGFETLVKDAHSSARNLKPDGLFNKARLLRGWTGDPLCMMSGLDKENFDAVAYTGYHSGAFTGGNSLAHTMTRRVYKAILNGDIFSEFVLNTYAAAYYGVPVVFLSGDEALCNQAKKYVPEIITVAAKTGIGGACLARSPEVVRAEINEKIKAALTSEHINNCRITLPESFDLSISYHDSQEAYRLSYYPGAEMTDDKTIRFCTKDYYEILRFVHFVL